MKQFKILLGVCIISLLCGCSLSDDSTSKVCSQTIQSYDIDFVLTSDSETGYITKVSLVVEMSYEDLGVSSADQLTNTGKDAVINNLKTVLGIDDEDEFSDTYDANGMHLEKEMDLSFLTDIVGTNIGLSMGLVTAALETIGMDCK